MRSIVSHPSARMVYHHGKAVDIINAKHLYIIHPKDGISSRQSRESFILPFHLLLQVVIQIEGASQCQAKGKEQNGGGIPKVDIEKHPKIGNIEPKQGGGDDM